MNKTILFFVSSLLMLSISSFAQTITTGTYYIDSQYPFNTAWEDQWGVNIASLNNGDVFVAGEIVYIIDVGNGHYGGNERQFVFKTDSMLNIMWSDSFPLFQDGFETHRTKSIIQLPDSNIFFDLDASFSIPDKNICKRNLNGDSIWNKQIPTPISNSYLKNNFLIQANDTILVTGNDIIPYLAAINTNGDTLFTKDYTGSINSIGFSIQKDYDQKLYLLSDSAGFLMVMKINSNGVINSGLTFSLSTQFPGQEEQFLCLDNNHFVTTAYPSTSLIRVRDSLGYVTDSVYWANRIQRILPTKKSNFIALDYGEVMLFSDRAQLQWRFQSNAYDYFYYGIQADDSTYFITGYRADSNQNHIDSVLIQKIRFPYSSTHLQPASTQFCTSDSMLINAPAGYSVLWSTGDTSTSIYGTSPGSYSAVITKNGFTIYTDTIVLINHQPFSFSLGNDTTVCPDNIVPIHAPVNYQSYQWQDHSSDSILYAAAAGDYWVNITDTNGCQARDTIRVNNFAAQLSLGNDTVICHVDTITIHAGNSYSNYLWQDGSQFESFSASTLLPAPDSVLLWVNVTDTNSCIQSDSLIVVFDVCQEIRSNSKSNSIQTYPNPVKDIVHISGIADQSKEYFIYSIDGRLVLSGKTVDTIDLSELEGGVYLLMISDEDNRSVLRVNKI